MARANRYFIPGHVWHITHRCHKRDFLLKFSKDRNAWLSWFYEAKKRFGLRVLNFMVTSNHIHLLVVDSGNDVIPKPGEDRISAFTKFYSAKRRRKYF